MNKTPLASHVKKRLEYQEAKPEEDDPTNPKSPNYDFAAKFRRNRETAGGKRSMISEKVASVKDTLDVKESLVVEQDPQAVKVTFEKPPSMAYKAFVKSYIVDTQQVFAFMCPVLLALVAIILGIFVQVKSVGVTQYQIDYGTMLVK